MDNECPCTSHSSPNAKHLAAASKSASFKDQSSASKYSSYKESSFLTKSSSSKEPSSSFKWSSKLTSSSLKSSIPSCSYEPSSILSKSKSYKQTSFSSKSPSSKAPSSTSKSSPKLQSSLPSNDQPLDICPYRSDTVLIKNETIGNELPRTTNSAQVGEKKGSERIFVGEKIVIKTYDPKTKKLVSQKEEFIPATPVEENLDRIEEEYINPSFMAVYSSSSHTSKQLSKPTSFTSKPLSKPVSSTSKPLSKPVSFTSKPLSKPVSSTSKHLSKPTSLHEPKPSCSKPLGNEDMCDCASLTDSKKGESIKDISLSGKTTFAEIAEKKSQNERLLLGENIVIRSYDDKIVWPDTLKPDFSSSDIPKIELSEGCIFKSFANKNCLSHNENTKLQMNDPKSKRLVSQRKGYISAKSVAQFMENLDRVEAEHADASFPSVYDSYLQRTGQLKNESMPMKIRIQKYWKTHDLVIDNDDINYRMQISMVELATFLIFVFILTLTLYLDVYPSQYKYHFTNSVRRAFITSDFKNLIKIQMNFKQIKSAGDIWGYLTKKLIETLHPTYYYNFDELRIKRLYFYDNNPIYENALIGTTRIIMKRVKNDSCLVHSAFRRLFKRVCYTYFSPSVEDKRPLGTDFVWYYQEGASNDTGTWGNYGHYTTGGYSQLLFWKSERDSRMLLYSMKNNHWLTRATRALIVDFLLFNPTINYFCKVRMTFELPPEGGVNPLVSIDTVKLIFPIGTRDYIVLGLFFVIFWFGIYYMIEEVKRISFFNYQYCLHLKRFVDLAICLLTMYIVIYILVKTFYLRNYITKVIRGTIKRRYISLDNVIRFEKIYMQIAGLLLFLCFLKLTYFMNLTNCMVVLNVTIKRAMKQFIGYLLYFGLILSAFASVAHLAFGTQSNCFRTWTMSFFSLIRVFAGEFNYLEFYESDKIFGPIFFSIYLFTVCFHLVFVYLAIVHETFQETLAEQERLGIEHSLPFNNYLQRGLTKFLSWFRLGKRPDIQKCESKEARDTLLEVKNALLKNNFTLTEINMFFAKYGIDYKRCRNPRDVQRIVQDLERKGYCPMEPPTREDIMACNRWKTELEPEEILATPRHQRLMLNFKDFKDLMERMRHIEKKITQTSRRVAVICDLADYYNKHFWSVPMIDKKGEVVWHTGRVTKKLSILEKLDKKFGRKSCSDSRKTRII